MIKKFAEAPVQNVISAMTFRKLAEDPDVMERFRRTTEMLREAQVKVGGKKLAPKVDDFLYGVCIMMHAAEAALVNQSTGDFIANAEGKPSRGWFENTTDSRGKPTVKWCSPDNIKMYKNANGDIFPEEDLLAKHKEWVGKPLCKDHQSNSVDGIRGIVVDTFYDPKFKRVYALFALDRKNYPDLARKVEAGYATCVSMGTAVGRAICTECGNVATTEPEYCHHIKARANYGEINKDLSPIELSLVVTGADSAAKIKEVLASLKTYVTDKESQIKKSTPNSIRISQLMSEIKKIERDLLAIKYAEVDLSQLSEVLQNLESRKPGDPNVAQYESRLPKTKEELMGVRDVGLLTRLLHQAKRFDLDIYQNVSDVLANLEKGEGSDLSIKNQEAGSVKNPEQEKATGMEDSAGFPLNQEFPDDSHTGDLLPTDLQPPADAPMAAFTSLYSRLNKAGEFSQEAGLNDKFASLKEKIMSLESIMKTNEEKPMNFAAMKERALKRREAYHQGTEAPHKYDLMGDQDKIRNTQDKQMVGDEVDYGSDSEVLPKGDRPVKEHMQRASLEERRIQRAALLDAISKSATGGEVVYDKTGNPVGIKTPDGKMKPVAQAAKDKDSDKEKEKAKKEKEKEKMKKEKEKEKEKAEKEKAKAKKEKKAYWQGTEEPTPGKTRYELMGDQEKLRATQDKQMSGQGMEPGNDGMHPGYGESDESKKRYWQRMANLRAKLVKGASTEAKWDIFADDEKVLTVSAADVYSDVWGDKIASTDTTFGDYFQSENYGRRLMGLVRDAAGPAGAAQALELPAAPAAPAPEAHGEGAGEHDKVLAAIHSAQDALADAESALGGGDLKDVSVPEKAEPEAGAPMAAQSETEELRLVKAEVTAALDELTLLEGELDDGNEKVASLVDEAIEDTNAVVAHYVGLLQAFAKKKDKKEDDKKAKEKAKEKEKAEKEKEKMKKEKEKMKAKKSDSELLNDLLKVRADNRAALVARAMEALDEDLGLSEQELDDLLAEHSDLIGDDHGHEHGAGEAYDMMVDDMCAKDKKKKEKDEEEEEEKDDKEEKDEKDAKDAKDAKDGNGPQFGAPAEEGAVRDEKSAKDGKKEDKKDKKEKEEEEEKDEKEDDKDDEKDAKDGSKEDGVSPKEKAFVKEEIKDHDESPKAHQGKMSRKEWRDQLVAKAKAGGFQYADIIGKAHQGKGTAVSFDAKVSDEGNLVENIMTNQAKNLDVARSEPRNVRMAAEKLNQLIAKGSIDPKDLEELVAAGAVDPAAAKYWKDFYKQSPDGGAEFGAEMSKDFEQHKKKASTNNEVEVREARLRRAFDLGMQAQDKGIISKSASELNKYVDNLIQLPDHVFESVKNIVSQHKKASAVAVPQMGLTYDNDDETVKTASVRVPSSFEDLAQMWR